MRVTDNQTVEILSKKKTVVIKPVSGWFNFSLKELIHYKDLVLLFVKRDFVSLYKQTILGPAWAIIQPFLTTVIFSFIFGNIAGLAPGGIPNFIFYFTGNTIWHYFAHCLTQTSNTFIANSSILGKVYFPRLVMPISTVISKLIDFGIQFVFLLGFLLYYVLTNAGVHPNAYMLLTPILLIQLAALSLGCGIIISACTTKYRDLRMLVSFGVQLWMYATPIVYPLSTLGPGLMRTVLLIPLSRERPKTLLA